LTAAGIEVLYDDRDERPGKKFADAELLGIPYRVVVSSKTVSGAGCELKARTSETVEQISVEDLVKKLTA
jgi:prolyl-tRNA synthetase